MVAAHSQAVSLRSRMISAASWLVSGTLASQALRLVSNLILTRLLVPEAFGLMAAVGTLYFGLVMFSDLGIWQSVVRSQRGTDVRFLGTAWSIQILRGALLGVLVLILAFGVSHTAQKGWFSPGTVYADDRLPTMIAVFALCAVIQGFQSMQVATAQREMLTRFIVRLELTAQIVTIIVIVGLAYATRSVWALLIGTLAGEATKTVLSYVLIPTKRVEMCWDKDAAVELIGFGKWIFLSSIVGFLASQGEKLILGAYLGLVTFGVYSIAANLMSAVIAIYSGINGRVIFPSLSLVHRESSHMAMAEVYGRMQKFVDLFLGCIAGTLFFLGGWIVEILYDERYHGAGWMLGALAVGLTGLRFQLLEQLMFAMGKPHWVTANNVLRALCLLFFIPLGFSWGGEAGAIWAIVLSQFASWPLSLVFKYQQNVLSWATEKWWAPSVLAGMALGYCLEYIVRTMS